ncbi:MAG: [protein-PII] uridylyltransferase [Azonexus sp.]|jgi:[protein-PII] uridylyltransferase|nr:[protein-PII] uridylyltransferase [Azonexus sp.]
MPIDPASLRREIKTAHDALRRDYERMNDATALLRGRCGVIDSVLKKLWQGMAMPSTAALVAVGGYGRGELYPASDVDLLILLPRPAGKALREKLEILVSHLWNIGLEIGHSVRTVAECASRARDDITICTALLEARLLIGDGPLFARLGRRLRQRFEPLAFLAAKRLEQQERYQRFDETPYSLEPNCKESPGGLRDIQTIFWIARAAGYGVHWADLESHGLISLDEAEHAEECEETLRHLRIRLHYAAGRRQEKLLFDYQEQLAAAAGFTDTPARRASEQLMQAYYRNAKAVMLLNVILLQNMEAALSPARELLPQVIDDDFQSVGNLLDVRDETLFERRPAAILDVFLSLQQHPELHDLTARTLRALWRCREWITPEKSGSPAQRAAFLRLFQSPRGVVRALRRMNQLDILGAYLPNFGRIVGQMQHDLFHVYTVDQHILQVIRNLRRFAMSEFAHEYPECSRLINEVDRHWLLHIAALFHDIAKGRGGDHSEQGAADARQFCEEHGLPDEDTELVVWLVKHHLFLSHVAQKKDLSDPQVIADFSRFAGDDRRLTALYLLTHADIRGTSPKVWNQWKGKLLADLYWQTLDCLHQGATPPAHGVIAERQAAALSLLRDFALPDTVHERLWKQLDTVYFLRHSAEEIAWHTRALHYRIDNRRPIVSARRQSDGLQVMVYTQDQPDLFARIVGFLARNGYNIVDAKIHTTAHGYALDSFVLLDTEERDNNRESARAIERELEQRLLRQAPLEPPPTGWLSRHVKHFPIKPEARIVEDERGGNFVLSLTAADRPGLLYAVANILARHGAHLQTAKIATLGERVEDVFLLSGGDLDDSASRIRLETELMERLKI